MVEMLSDQKKESVFDCDAWQEFSIHSGCGRDLAFLPHHCGELEAEAVFFLPTSALNTHFLFEVLEQWAGHLYLQGAVGVTFDLPIAT